jgi:hypothetical protein
VTSTSSLQYWNPCLCLCLCVSDLEKPMTHVRFRKSRWICDMVLLPRFFPSFFPLDLVMYGLILNLLVSMLYAVVGL